MINAPTRKLGDICEVASGGTPKRSEKTYWDGGTIPWVKISDITDKYVERTEEFITEEGLARSSAKLVQPGTVLYSIFASIGATGILSIPAATNQAIAAVRPKDESLAIDYLYHWLKAQEGAAKASSRGVAQSNINLSILRSMEIPVPSHDVQERIIANVDGILARRDDCEKQLKSFDELVKSRFVEMFGDPIENPKRWTKKPIGDIYEVGSAKRVYARDQVSEGVPFLRLGDLTNRIQQGIESCDLFITEEMYEAHKAKGLVPDAGDILVTARGTMGLCYEVKPEDRFYFQDGMITWLHEKPESPLPVFLTNLFANEHFVDDLHEHTSGTTVKYLSIKTLSQLPMILPPLTLQQEFATFVQKVDKLKFETQRAIEKLQMLYDSLAQEYFGS